MDPMKLPATTLINLHSNFVPNPRLPGVSAPVAANFAPTDNPTTFDQAAIQNTTKIYQSENRVSAYGRGRKSAQSSSSKVREPKKVTIAPSKPKVAAKTTKKSKTSEIRKDQQPLPVFHWSKRDQIRGDNKRRRKKINESLP